MLVAIALLILAVLLFGAARIIGALGFIMGIVAFCAAAIVAGVALDLSPEVAFGGVFLVLIAFAAWAQWSEKRERGRR